MISQVPYAHYHPIAVRQGLQPPAMLSQEGLLSPYPPPLHCNAIRRTPISGYPIFPHKAHQTYFSFSSAQVTHHRFSAVHGRIRIGVRAYALNSRMEGGNRLLEMEGEFDDEFGDGDDDDDEVFVPLMNMKKWLENKPHGFGEGKVYETSIEDKLLEEIEQSRRAQLANINKLKNNPQNPKPKKEQAVEKKSSEDVPSGFRVRLTNLPKKKNIHRDLQLAFKEVSGIVNIIPVVSGKKKTRDPICKGFAFVEFRSEDEASRFVQTFSRESVTFGRVQKQIKCEMASASFSKPADDQSVDGTNYDHQLVVPCIEGDLGAESDMGDPSLDSSGKTFFGEYEDADYEHISAQCDGNKEDLEVSALLEAGGVDSTVLAKESATNSSSSKHEEKIQANGRRLSSKQKKKIPKLSIPNGRLRVREKAVLSDVFSKYVANAALAMREQS